VLESSGKFHPSSATGSIASAAFMTPRTGERVQRVLRALEECGWLSHTSLRGSPLEYVEHLLSFAQEQARHQGPPLHSSSPHDGPALEELFELLSDSVLEAQALGELEPSMAAESIARGALVLLVCDVARCGEELPSESVALAPTPIACG
jgi:hypothetical protein